MRNSEYKAHIDRFVAVRWDFIRSCAKNIMKGKKQCPDDLVAELALFLYERKDMLESYILNDVAEYRDLTAFSVSWMKLQAQYPTSPFGRAYRPKATDWEMPDIAAEPENDTTEEEYIRDLRTIYSDEQVDKIMKIHDIYPNLSQTHQILFRAYFLEDLSYDKIRMKYSFFRTDKNGKKVYYKSKKSIYNLMMELKREINKRL